MLGKERVGEREERKREKRKEKKRKKEKERGKREKDCLGLLGFSKPEFIPFSYFRIEILILCNFGHIFYF